MSDVFLAKFLRQKAVYWAPKESDLYGVKGLEEPIEISCRWEDKANEFTKADGSHVVSRSVILVDRELKLGGWLWLGTLAVVNLIARENEGAAPIVVFNTTPNVKAKKFVRMAVL